MGELPCPAEALPALQASNAGGWMLLALIGAVLAYEAWAVWTGHLTISQWTARKTRGKPWLKVAFGAVIGLTLWHLLLGGPL